MSENIESDIISLDVETLHTADLKRIGAYEYAAHPDTDMICICWSVGGGPVQLWHPAFPEAGLEATPEPEEVFKLIRHGARVSAFNFWFEFCVFLHVLGPKYGWPIPRDEQWRCSLAKASVYGLPKDLKGACVALGLDEQKDAEGHTVMLKVARDAKFRTRENLERVFSYCAQDVRAEQVLSAALRDLSADEYRVWFLDFQANKRGVQIDRALAERAVQLTTEAKQLAEAELAKLTEGAVKKVTAKKALLEWLKSRGVDPPTKENPKGETIETTEGKRLALLETTDPTVSRVLELWQKNSKTSVAKYVSMLEVSATDGRARGLLQYHSAHTGRVAGRLLQPQNFARPEEGMDDPDVTVPEIMEYDVPTLELLYGPDSVLTLLSSSLRGAIIAGPGNVLVSSDYSAIEGRGAAWSSGDEEMLQMFRDLDAEPNADWDAYTWMASQMYDRRVTKADKGLRQEGKVGSLGCQYGMSAKKMRAWAQVQLGLDLDAETCERIVRGFRESRRAIVDFWYSLERAALNAVRRPGRVFNAGAYRWKLSGRFLYCVLPSNRYLVYVDPAIELDTRFGKDKLVYWGVNSISRKWAKHSTYGAKIFENVVQALCRDLMVYGRRRVIECGYPDVLTVHDELVSEVPLGFASVEEFERLMSEVPPWAEGFPVKAAGGWMKRRYRK